MVIILTACEPLHLYFTKEEYLNQIESIELIKYNNENYKDVDPSIDEIIFNFDKVETIEVLDRDMFEEFLTDYEKEELDIETSYQKNEIEKEKFYLLLTKTNK